MSGAYFNDIQYKASSGQVNLDQAQGIVECFVAGIGNKDSVGDVCATGAFAKSLLRRKPRVVWGHNWNDPIGKVLEIYEVPPNDPRLPGKMKAAGIGGLYAKVQFNLNSEKGREAFANVAFFGEEQEWSIGYKTLRAQFDQNSQANILYEVELYEVSPVLHGANQLTGTISVKNAEKGGTAVMPIPSSPMDMPEDEVQRKLQKEMSERFGFAVKISSVEDGFVTFTREGEEDGSTYKCGFHHQNGTFMLGRPERIQMPMGMPMQMPQQPKPQAMPMGMPSKPMAAQTPGMTVVVPQALPGGTSGQMPIIEIDYEDDDNDDKPKGKPKLIREEADLAEALIRITERHGKFDEDGTGVWAGYKPAAENTVAKIGVKCSNCVMYEGNGSCKIIAQKVEDNGKCRFAVIPEGVVKVSPIKKQEAAAQKEQEEVKWLKDVEDKYPDVFLSGELRSALKRKRDAANQSVKMIPISNYSTKSLRDDSNALYYVSVTPETAFEIKNAIDPIIDYYRAEAFVDEDGIVFTSGVNKDFAEAIDTAVKALGRNLAGKITRSARGLAARFDPKAWDGDNDGIVQEGTPYERPAIPGVNDFSTRGRVNTRKATQAWQAQSRSTAKPKATRDRGMSSGRRSLTRHSSMGAANEAKFPNKDENTKRESHEAFIKEWENGMGLPFTTIDRQPSEKGPRFTEDWMRSREVGYNDAKARWMGKGTSKRPPKVNDKQRSSTDYASWYMDVVGQLGRNKRERGTRNTLLGYDNEGHDAGVRTFLNEVSPTPESREIQAEIDKTLKDAGFGSGMGLSSGRRGGGITPERRREIDIRDRQRSKELDALAQELVPYLRQTGEDTLSYDWLTKSAVIKRALRVAQDVEKNKQNIEKRLAALQSPRRGDRQNAITDILNIDPRDIVRQISDREVSRMNEELEELRSQDGDDVSDAAIIEEHPFFDQMVALRMQEINSDGMIRSQIEVRDRAVEDVLDQDIDSYVDSIPFGMLLDAEISTETSRRKGLLGLRDAVERLGLLGVDPQKASYNATDDDLKPLIDASARLRGERGLSSGRRLSSGATNYKDEETYKKLSPQAQAIADAIQEESGDWDEGISTWLDWGGANDELAIIAFGEPTESELDTNYEYVDLGGGNTRGFYEGEQMEMWIEDSLSELYKDPEALLNAAAELMIGEKFDPNNKEHISLIKDNIKQAIFNMSPRNERGLSSGRKLARGKELDRRVNDPGRGFSMAELGFDQEFIGSTNPTWNGDPQFDEEVRITDDESSSGSPLEFIGNVVKFGDGRKGVLIRSLKEPDIDMSEDEDGVPEPRLSPGQAEILITHDKDGNMLDPSEFKLFKGTFAADDNGVSPEDYLEESYPDMWTIYDGKVSSDVLSDLVSITEKDSFKYDYRRLKRPRETTRGLSSGQTTRARGIDYRQGDPEQVGTDLERLSQRSDDLGANFRHLRDMAEEESIQFEYRGKMREVRPDPNSGGSLFNALKRSRDGALYFVGIDSESGEPRSFRLDRIDGLIVGADYGGYNSGWDGSGFNDDLPRALRGLGSGRSSGRNTQRTYDDALAAFERDGDDGLADYLVSNGILEEDHPSVRNLRREGAKPAGSPSYDDLVAIRILESLDPEVGGGLSSGRTARDVIREERGRDVVRDAARLGTSFDDLDAEDSYTYKEQAYFQLLDESESFRNRYLDDDDPTNIKRVIDRAESNFNQARLEALEEEYPDLVRSVYEELRANGEYTPGFDQTDRFVELVHAKENELADMGDRRADRRGLGSGRSTWDVKKTYDGAVDAFKRGGDDGLADYLVSNGIFDESHVWVRSLRREGAKPAGSLTYDSYYANTVLDSLAPKAGSVPISGSTRKPPFQWNEYEDRARSVKKTYDGAVAAFEEGGDAGLAEYLVSNGIFDENHVWVRSLRREGAKPAGSLTHDSYYANTVLDSLDPKKAGRGLSSGRRGMPPKASNLQKLKLPILLKNPSEDDDEKLSDDLEKLNDDLFEQLGQIQDIGEGSLGRREYLKRFSGAVPRIEEIAKDYDSTDIYDRHAALSIALDEVEKLKRGIDSAISNRSGLSSGRVDTSKVDITNPRSISEQMRNIDSRTPVINWRNMGGNDQDAVIEATMNNIEDAMKLRKAIIESIKEKHPKEFETVIKDKSWKTALPISLGDFFDVTDSNGDPIIDPSIEDLADELDSFLDAADMEIGDQSDLVGDLNDKLDDLQEKRIDLGNEIRSADSDIEEAREEINDLGEQLRNSELTTDEYDSLVEKLKEQIDKKTKDRSDLLEELEGIRAEQRNTASDLEEAEIFGNRYQDFKNMEAENSVFSAGATPRARRRAALASGRRQMSLAEEDALNQRNDIASGFLNEADERAVDASFDQFMQRPARERAKAFAQYRKETGMAANPQRGSFRRWIADLEEGLISRDDLAERSARDRDRGLSSGRIGGPAGPDDRTPDQIMFDRFVLNNDMSKMSDEEIAQELDIDVADVAASRESLQAEFDQIEADLEDYYASRPEPTDEELQAEADAYARSEEERRRSRLTPRERAELDAREENDVQSFRDRERGLSSGRYYRESEPDFRRLKRQNLQKVNNSITETEDGFEVDLRDRDEIYSISEVGGQFRALVSYNLSRNGGQDAREYEHPEAFDTREDAINWIATSISIDDDQDRLMDSGQGLSSGRNRKKGQGAR